MENLIQLVQDHALYAHWVVFGLLMLAGLNFPISEDLLIVVSGVLASTFVPQNTWKLFAAVFIGAYCSDWIVYWIGRLWGAKLWKIRWFARVFSPKKLSQITDYYERYGVLTLFFGRFIPFGVRNCLFVTAGIGKMHFGKFLLADGIACLLSNAALFTLSYFCGKNCSYLLKFVNVAIFTIFVLGIVTFVWWRKRKKVDSAEDA